MTGSNKSRAEQEEGHNLHQTCDWQSRSWAFRHCAKGPGHSAPYWDLAGSQATAQHLSARQPSTAPATSAWLCCLHLSPMNPDCILMHAQSLHTSGLSRAAWDVTQLTNIMHDRMMCTSLTSGSMLPPLCCSAFDRVTLRLEVCGLCAMLALPNNAHTMSIMLSAGQALQVLPCWTAGASTQAESLHMGLQG